MIVVLGLEEGQVYDAHGRFQARVNRRPLYELRVQSLKPFDELHALFTKGGQYFPYLLRVVAGLVRLSVLQIRGCQSFSPRSVILQPRNLQRL